MKNVFNLKLNERMQVVLMLFISTAFKKMILPSNIRPYRKVKLPKEVIDHNHYKEV